MIFGIEDLLFLKQTIKDILFFLGKLFKYSTLYCSVVSCKKADDCMNKENNISNETNEETPIKDKLKDKIKNEL